MKRLTAISSSVALAAGLLAATAAPARADAESSTVSDVVVSWAASTIRVSFSQDTWSYGRVDVSVDGTPTASKVLDDFASGRDAVSVARARSLGATPVVVTMTSCDDDPVEEPATACATTTVFAGTVRPVQATPKGKADAVRLLAGLTVRGESHAGSYARAEFAVWNDADHDGEDTRAEVLKSESRITASVNSHGTVKGGKWLSAYDNRILTKASRLDVDHLVPLAEAWASGAWRWSPKKREAYGNDVGFGASLIAVSASSNRSKGDSDPAEWMPAAKGYSCAYVRNWVAVKSRWHLSVDRDERTALGDVLDTCTSYAVAKPGSPKVASLVEHRKAKKQPVSSGGSRSGGGTSSGLDPRYGTCTELLRHANHAPYVRGTDPEYAWYQDRDRDGRVCE